MKRVLMILITVAVMFGIAGAVHLVFKPTTEEIQP